MTNSYKYDIDLIQRIGAISSILNVICRVTGMGFAAIARVTESNWIACSVRDQVGIGIKQGDTLVAEATACLDVSIRQEPIIVDDVEQSAAFKEHPMSNLLRFRSYAAAPIVLADGSVFGTLCALDPQPRSLGRPEVVEMFSLFAELIGFHIDGIKNLDTAHSSLGMSEAKLGISERKLGVSEVSLSASNTALDASQAKLGQSEAALNVSESRLGVSEAALLDERATPELREQFIAVLGHDLRNPLSAISGAAHLIAKTPLNERATKLVASLQSSVMRMAGLIDNVLDFARGRLGSGLTLSRDLDAGIEATLRQAVEELRIIAPDRDIIAEYDLTDAVDCDRARIAQLFSNLLGNALTHGAATSPIRIHAATIDGEFVLEVANGGTPIPPAALERLFQPFYRGAVRPSQQGLGLGLFIASEIARAHRGTLSVTSDNQETRFTFRMPLVQIDREGLERPD